MTWELSQCIARHKISIVAALNLLQGNHVISDLVVNPEDVWEGDCPAAIAWLDANHKPLVILYNVCNRFEKWVEIDPGELAHPEQRGNDIYAISEEKQLKEKCPLPDKHKMPARGNCGEWIVAKGLALPYLGREGAYRKADLGHNIEVKSTYVDRYGLKVPIDQDGDSKVVGVIIPDWNFNLPKYRITGWIYARDAKKPEWLNDWNARDQPCYTVPQEFLRPIWELELIIAEEKERGQ